MAGMDCDLWTSQGCSGMGAGAVAPTSLGQDGSQRSMNRVAGGVHRFKSCKRLQHRA